MAEYLDSVDPLKDGISKIELIDYMGDDVTVVNAARVSFNKESEWEVPCPDMPVLKHGDGRLINFLARHGHWTPFAHTMLQFRIKAPFFIARQWFRHQVGISRNEVSRRYVREQPEVFMPGYLRKAGPDIKQGSIDEDAGYPARVVMDEALEQAETAYLSLIAQGVCPEQARGVLPLASYTEWVETGSIAAYARIFNQRAPKDAQQEVRQYALALPALIPPKMTKSWDSLTRSTVDNL